MAADSTWNFTRELGYNSRPGINQAVEKRSGLLFNYGSNDGATKKRWLPFYENPTITESRKANYASTDIFLRNEPVRLFTGAHARQFRVDIHYTLIHMASMVPTAHILKMFSDDQRLDDEEITAVEAYVRDVIGRDTGSGEITGVNSAQLSRAVQAINGTPNVPSTATNQFSNDFPNKINNMDELNSIANKQKGTAASFLDALAIYPTTSRLSGMTP